VRERRGARLSADEAALFDGGWMLGERAKQLGLVDRLGDLDAVVREVGGPRARPRAFRPRRRWPLLSRLPRLLVREALEAALEVAEEPRGPGARF
jgi:ClpP class serine protease